MEKDQIFILKDRGVVFISGENVKDFLQNIVTNLSHLPENIKIFSDRKAGIPADVPLVNIKTHYFKTREMITLLKTERDNYIKETELANYNQNMMHINSFLEKFIPGLKSHFFIKLIASLIFLSSKFLDNSFSNS